MTLPRSSSDKVRELLKDSITTQALVLYDDALVERIARAAALIEGALKKGKKVLLCGNGGSASDAQHFAAELVGRFQKERRALPAVALTTDTSILTALANDYAFDVVFERQVEALAQKGDVLFAISTSGRAKNVAAAVRRAKKMGCVTIGLTGKDGGELKRLAHLALVMPSPTTARIQEAHITVIHILCELVESAFSR